MRVHEILIESHVERTDEMTTFTFLYRGREISASPEQMQKTTEKWLAWFKELEAQGAIGNIGHPLDDSGKVVSGKSKLVQDGPFAEAKDVVAGFTMVQAETLDHAAELARGCPILEVGGSVEVRPVRTVNL
jgi:hypothetical protein